MSATTNASLDDDSRQKFRFFLLGVGTLLPFNVFITSKPYFDMTLIRSDDQRKTKNAEETVSWFTTDSFENAFSFAYTASNLATLLVLHKMKLFQRIERGIEESASEEALDDVGRERQEFGNDKTTSWFRTLHTYDKLTTFPLLACALCFFASALLSLDETISGTFIVSFAVMNLLLFGILTALVQSGSFALAAIRNRSFSNAVVSGQALSGVLASLVALTCSAFNFAPIYFGIAGTASLFCAKGAKELVFEMTRGMEVVEDRGGGGAYSAVAREINAGTDDDDDRPTTISTIVSDINENENREDAEEGSTSLMRLMGGSAVSSSSGPVRSPGGGEFTLFSSPSTTRNDEQSIVGRDTWMYRWAVFLTFTVTLTAFPAITSSISTRDNAKINDTNKNEDSNNNYWTSLLFLLFNVGDLFGRIFEGSTFARTRGFQNVSGEVAFRRSLYRIVFVPILAMCNVDRLGWRIPRLFIYDFFPASFILSLGFTNGFNAACSMALGPQTVGKTNGISEIESTRMKSEEGATLGIGLSAGIAFGSVVSIAVCGLFTAGGYL
jgi:solute carrier family 29 (equilibrative nucleoside transporter), member 1/2/3